MMKRRCGVVSSLILMFALCPLTAQAQTTECLNWTQKNPATAPSARQVHQAAYDSNRNVVVIFGGFSGSGAPLGDTWEWNGINWTQVSTTGPSARDTHAMAYNSAANLTYLFGGTDYPSPNIFSDMWSWNGTTWTQVPASGSWPAARQGHTMIYDSARDVLVLYGGRKGLNPADYFSDTWEWNGSVWTQRCTGCGPGPRGTHAMTYDAPRQVSVVFGGADGSSPYYTDTWEWDGSTWTQKCSSCPPPGRGWPEMAYDKDRGVSVLFGGCNGVTKTCFDDTWEWDGTTWTEQTLLKANPPARMNHVMAFDEARHVVTVFGGVAYGSPSLGDTWVYGGSVLCPTVTTWGLGVLSLLLLTAATLVVRRRGGFVSAT